MTPLRYLVPTAVATVLSFVPLVLSQSACFSKINQIVIAESMAPSTVFLRSYTMCPFTNYTVGNLNFYNQFHEGSGDSMIPLRPNMLIRCGYTGRRDGNCIVTGGSVFVDGTTYHNIADESVDGVTIEGFTFVGPQKFAAEFNKPGRVTFRDCIFRDSINGTAAVYADYFGLSETNSLEITFQRCDFIGNTYQWNGGQAALVIGNSMQNRLIFSECRFEDNDMVFNNTSFETNSYLIESSGPLELVNNCFSNNSVGVATVSSFSTLMSSGNFGTTTTGGKCPFVARFTSAMRYELFAPECANYEAATCGISATFAPIGSPTISPSDVPTSVPTLSVAPTEFSTLEPTSEPTTMPSKSPFAEPSSSPSSSEAKIQAAGSAATSSNVNQSSAQQAVALGLSTALLFTTILLASVGAL